jgi:Tfp pilus assembly protein PilN
MALRLNLHHEIQKQRALNRRDPLKLSMYGLGAIAACMAGYYVLQLGLSHGVESDRSAAQAEFDKLKPKAAQAAKREEELTKQVKLSEALVKRIENRFYWATVLDSLSQTVPHEVQITKLSGDVASDKTRRCTISLEGISAGIEPRKVAEDLRRTLQDQFGAKYKKVNAKFSSLDDGKDTARVGGQQIPTAVFAINLQMQTGEDEAVAAPAARRAAPAPAAGKKNDGGML